MEERTERRAFERLEFTGAQVSYEKEKVGFSLTNRLCGPLSLKDINICGACLKTDNPLDLGDLLYLAIFIPNVEEIRIIGNVRWTEYCKETDNYCTGVQFFQFGWGEHFDSIDHMQRLQKICDNYHSMKDFPYNSQINSSDLPNNLLDS